jgi:predicted transcriptional regulator
MRLSPTSIKLDPELKERVQRLAVTQRRSANWLMGEAIREFLAREEAREALNRDTVERWEEYKATGKHVSFEDADAWLAQLEAGEIVEPPKPE